MADNKSLYEIRLKVTTEDLKKAEREITNFSSNIKNSISKSIESIATGMPKALSMQELWKGVGDVEAGLKKIQNIFPSSGLKPIASLEKSLSSLRIAINKGLSGENLFSSVKKEAGQAINSIQAIERQLDKAFVTKVKKAGLHLFSQGWSENPFTGGRFKEMGQTMFSPLTPPRRGREASIIGGLSAMKQFYGTAEPSSTAIYQKLLSKEEGVVANYKKLGATLTALNQRIKELALKPRDFFGDPRELDALVAKYRQAAREIESVLNIAKSQTMLNNQWLPGVRIGGELVSSRMAKTKAKELSQYYKEMGAEEIKQQKNREAESEKASKLFGAQGYIQERGTFITDLTRRVDILRNLQNTLKNMRAGTFLKQFPDDVQKSIKDPQKFMQDFVSNIGRDLKTAEKQLHGFRKGFSAMTGNLIYDLKEVMKYQTRWYLARALLFAPLQVGANTVKNYAEWEQGIKNAGAVSEYTTEQMEQLKKVTLDIGKTTSISAKEASQASLEFAQAGVTFKDTLTALPLAAKMVIPTGEKMESAVSALTTAIFSWKLQSKDVPKVASEIGSAMADSKLKIADLSTVFNYLASLAASFNLTTKETLSLMTLLSKAGVVPSTIGTGLRQVLAQLAAQPPRLKKMLDEVGKDYGWRAKDFSTSLNHPIEALKKLFTVMRDGKLDTTELFSGFQMRAGASVIALSRLFLSEWDTTMQKIGDPAWLERAFKLSMSGIINQLKRTGNIIEAELYPALDKLGGKFAEILKVLNDWEVESNSISTILNILLIFIGAKLATLLPKLLTIIKELASLRIGLVALSAGWTIPLAIVVTAVMHFGNKAIKTEAKDIGNNLKKLTESELKEGLNAIESEEEVSGFEGNKTLAFYKKMGKNPAFSTTNVKALILEELKNRNQVDEDAYTPTPTPKKPPPDKNKGITTNKLEAIYKRFREQEIAIEKYYSQMRLAILESSYKLGFISEKDYYNKSLNLTEDSLQKELNFAREYRAKFDGEFKANLDKEIASVKDNADKQEALKEEFKSKIMESDRKIIDLENQVTTNRINRTTDYYQKMKTLLIEHETSMADIRQSVLERSLAEEQGTLDRRKTLNDYLFGKNRISAIKYFADEEDKINSEKAASYKKADEKLLAERNKIYLDFFGGNTTEFGVPLTEDKEKQYNDRKAKAEEDNLKSRLDADIKYKNEALRLDLERRESIKLIYAGDGGVAGTIGKAFQDLNTEWSNVGQHIYDTTKNIVSGMENSFGDFFDYMSDGFMDFENLAKNVLHTIYMELLKTILLKQIMGGLFGGTGGLGGAIAGLFSGGTAGTETGAGSGIQNPWWSLAGRAGGGSVSLNTPYIVGESGPELFVPGASGSIVPNNRLSASSAPTLVVNVENKTGKQVKASQSQPQFDGKRWIRTVMLELAESDMGIRSKYGTR